MWMYVICITGDILYIDPSDKINVVVDILSNDSRFWVDISKE